MRIKKKILISLFIVGVFASIPAISRAATLIDSYSESNQDDKYNVAADAPQYAGQSFANTNNITLDSATLYLKKNGTITGNMYAVIYAHTGTYGTNGKPTGSALATSDALDASSTLTTSYQLINFTFSGANRITLSTNTKYVLQFNYAGTNFPNYVGLGLDVSAPTAAGNASYSNTSGSTWESSSYDAPFYVYGDTPPPTIPIRQIRGVGISR